jgi:hypothetical protein
MFQCLQALEALRKLVLEGLQALEALHKFALLEHVRSDKADTVQLFVVLPPKAHLDAHWATSAAESVHAPAVFYKALS